jgi:hypothetical protein
VSTKIYEFTDTDGSKQSSGSSVGLEPAIKSNENIKSEEIIVSRSAK